MTVTYENLIENPESELQAILGFLNLQIPAGNISVNLKPTRSAFSDMVRAKYNERYAGGSRIGSLLRNLRRRLAP